jgi:flagellar biosynthesis protein FlhB
VTFDGIVNYSLDATSNEQKGYILHCNDLNMGENAVMLIGVLIGFLFGMSGIATLFNFMSEAMTETAMQISQMSALSTIMLLIIAIVLIIKIRIISALIVGAIVGAVLNTIFEMNGIHVVNDVYSTLLDMLKTP